MKKSKCPKCNELFVPTTKHNHTTKFCSRKCANSRGLRTEEFKKTVSEKLKGKPSPFKGTSKKTGPIYVRKIDYQNCVVCNNLLISGPHNHYRKTCSDTCKQEQKSLAGRASAAKQVRRSKDEIRLYKLCEAHFKNVNHNKVLIDGWDADIIIYDETIAILWNGIWHRKQMPHKNHSISQVQNRDRLKKKTLSEAGWKVLVFEDDQWTPQTAFENILKWC